MFPALRLHHGIARKKSTTKTIPGMVGNDEFVPLPPDIAPGIVALPVLQIPDLFTGEARAEDAVPMSHWYMTTTTDDAAERGKALKESGVAKGLAYSSIPLGHFVRTLAHIGHAFYMAAAVDADRQASLLLRVARGDLRHASRVVGGFPPNAPPLPQPSAASGIHQILPLNAMCDGEQYVIALIRLFTHLRPLPPVYVTVLCKRKIAQGDKYLLFERQEGTHTVNVEELTMAG